MIHILGDKIDQPGNTPKTKFYLKLQSFKSSLTVIYSMDVVKSQDFFQLIQK